MLDIVYVWYYHYCECMVRNNYDLLVHGNKVKKKLRAIVSKEISFIINIRPTLIIRELFNENSIVNSAWSNSEN